MTMRPSEIVRGEAITANVAVNIRKRGTLCWKARLARRQHEVKSSRGTKHTAELGLQTRATRAGCSDNDARKRESERAVPVGFVTRLRPACSANPSATRQNAPIGGANFKRISERVTSSTMIAIRE